MYVEAAFGVVFVLFFLGVIFYLHVIRGWNIKAFLNELYGESESTMVFPFEATRLLWCATDTKFRGVITFLNMKSKLTEYFYVIEIGNRARILNKFYGKRLAGDFRLKDNVSLIDDFPINTSLRNELVEGVLFNSAGRCFLFVKLPFAYKRCIRTFEQKLESETIQFLDKYHSL
jgi:hypothetical protein